ncbi:hypothetical protein KEJ28_03325, partial [Candidatus Bathyarchaeota archaeon]|nr:hypothetical protein [Candidatus Bathyarchaeota archaeon]
MAKIACFVEKYNFLHSAEEKALLKFKETAERLGHSYDFIFKEDLSNLLKYDAVFIRATTDPLYTSSVVSKMAWEHGLKV